MDDRKSYKFAFTYNESFLTSINTANVIEIESYILVTIEGQKTN